MAGYVVSGESGEVRVDASNWLGALGLALPQLGLSAGALGRLVCSVGADGSAEACDPVTNTRLKVTPLEPSLPRVFGDEDEGDAFAMASGEWPVPEGEAAEGVLGDPVADSLGAVDPAAEPPAAEPPAAGPPAEPAAADSAADGAAPAAPADPESTATAPRRPPSPTPDVPLDAFSSDIDDRPLRPPTPAPAAEAPAAPPAEAPAAAAKPAAAPTPTLDLDTFAPLDPDDPRLAVLDERLAVVRACTEVRGACAAALTLTAELVPADAGAVLVLTRSGRTLRFVAAFGEASARIVDTAVPVEEGFAGFCQRFQVGVVVGDVGGDERHYKRVDRASGYRTHSLLAVPLMMPDGGSAGVLELLNSPVGFTTTDIEIASRVARALATLVHAAMHPPSA